MKNRFILFTLIILSISCKTKNDPIPKQDLIKISEYEKNTFEFLNSKINLNEELILSDKPEMHDYLDCISNLEQDTIFSAEEIKFIKKNIETSQIQKWKSEMVPKAKIISQDTLKNLFKNSKNLGWQEFRKRYGKSVYTYSAPIFLRDYSICIFYFGKSCGSLCGHGGLMLYKKEDNEWKSLKTYCSWMS